MVNIKIVEVIMMVWRSDREAANGISRSNEDTTDQSSIGQTQNIMMQILILNMRDEKTSTTTVG